MECHGCVNLFIVHLYPYALCNSDNCSAGCYSAKFHSKNDTVQNVNLQIAVLSFAKCCSSELHSVECHSSESYYAEHHSS
jgi:hypothetical protein